MRLSRRLKRYRCVWKQSSISRPVKREDAEVYTPIGLFNRGRGIFRKAPTRGDNLGDSTFFWIEDGDLVLSGQFAWEGAIALAGSDEADCIASHRYHILRGKEGITQTTYLASFLRTSFGQLLLDEHSRGAAGRNRPLNIRTLLKEKIPCPASGTNRRGSSRSLPWRSNWQHRSQASPSASGVPTRAHR